MSESEAEKASQLPDPAGYKILCAIPEIEHTFEGGIIKADTTVKHEELMATVLFVVKMGPDCYKDESRFPNGAYCKEGDFIIVKPLSGVRLNIHGRQFRLINDDSVEGVVQDPRGIYRG